MYTAASYMTSAPAKSMRIEHTYQIHRNHENSVRNAPASSLWKCSALPSAEGDQGAVVRR